ncbi:MAG TPA: DUF1801 domain-containing protein [Holophagaceae bacterium]|nr:DUF1801 domain-containing protein [Holophagaceae bacterium]
MKDQGKQAGAVAPDPIGAKLATLRDWRGETLAALRALIREADPEVGEELKWGDTPTWSHGGILCTGESYKATVKLTFLKGAALPDPTGLFNASLDGKARRAIDLREGERLDPEAFKALIRAAVALNTATSAKQRPPKSVP